MLANAKLDSTVENRKIVSLSGNVLPRRKQRGIYLGNTVKFHAAMGGGFTPERLNMGKKPGKKF